jgi:hypothetical protein
VEAFLPKEEGGIHMFGLIVRRAYWPVTLTAAVGLVFGVSSAQAVNKNPGDPFGVGIVNTIDQLTTLEGNSVAGLLFVHNTGTSFAIAGLSAGPDSNGVGVRGIAAGGGNGVEGVALNRGSGVFGSSLYGPGVQGESYSRPGVLGRHVDPGGGPSTDTPAVEGDTASTAIHAVGVVGQVTSTTPGVGSVGVRGINNGRGAFGIGVSGTQYGSGWGVSGTSPSGRGVYGFSAAGIGVMGETSNGLAGFFRGGDVRVHDGDLIVSGGDLLVSGDMSVGGWKMFRIEDPLDPKHKYLAHAAVESNQVLNIYSGNITTDQHGVATVRLPAYFERINTDLRYQLTVIGQFAQAIIAKKEAGNRFGIRTDKPRVEVSWQVTALRNDAYMRDHPFHDIQNKGKAEKPPVGLNAKPGSQAVAP